MSTTLVLARLALLIALLAPVAAAAQAPLKLGYQGRLLKADGAPETGVVSLSFSIFPSLAGGTPLWTEMQTVALADGYYATFLGTETALSTELFLSGPVFLEVGVNGTALSPRQAIASVAYALVARGLEGGAVDATSIAVNGTTVIDSSGKLASSAALAETDPTVGAHAKAAAPSSCTAAQKLAWNGTAWSCEADVDTTSSGTVTSVTGTLPVSVSNGTTTPSISIADATASTKGVLQVGTGLTSSAGTVSVAFGTTAGTAAAGDDSRLGNASSLAGRDVSSAAPITGQFLSWDGSAWVPAAEADPTVGAHAKASVPSTCTAAQKLVWNGTAWSCAADVDTVNAGTVTSVSGSLPVSVSNGTTTPSISIADATASAKGVVQVGTGLTASAGTVSVAFGTTAGTAAAGNDGRFGNATSLGGRAVSSTAPAVGQYLYWDGSSWVPRAEVDPSVPSGTMCGYWAQYTNTFFACAGHNPLSSCPAGYTQAMTAAFFGSEVTYRDYTCRKN